MTRDQLMNAEDGILKVIIAQGEKRLDGQCAFASVQDARSGSFVGASVALAAAALTVAAAAITLKGVASPVAVGAIVATIGFSTSSFLGLWGSRACNFHAAGWYPNDFADDVTDGRSLKDLDVDFAIDLQCRLSENRTALIRRGDFHNAATILLLATPLLGLIAALLAAGG